MSAVRLLRQNVSIRSGMREVQAMNMMKAASVLYADGRK